MADREVGSILAYLKLDRSDWSTEMKAAGAEADDLARKNPNVKITTNAGEAIAQLAAVAAATKKLQDAQGSENVAQAKLQALVDKGIESGPKYVAAQEAVARSHRSTASAVVGLANAYQQVDAAATKAAAAESRRAAQATKSNYTAPNPLVLGGAALGPAAVPLAGVGAGAILGLLPLAATAALAFAGISTQMRSAAASTTQFGQNVGVLKLELTTLEQTAASGIMKAFGGDLTGLKAQFPALNADVAQYSAQLGQIAANTGPGVLALLHGLQPLFSAFSSEIVRGSADFEKWATSTGAVTKFSAYIQAELPQVEHTLSELLTTVSHLVQAFAPLGSTSLSEIGLLSRAINAIPVNVLQTLVPLVVDGYLAFKAYEGLNAIGPMLDRLTGSFRGVAVAEAAAGEAAAGAELTMGSMLGPVGAIIVGVGLLASTFLGSNNATIQAKAVMDSYTAAVQADNDAIGKNVELTAAKNLQDAGAFVAGQKLGLSSSTVLQATLGNVDAQKQVAAATGNAESAYKALTDKQTAYSRGLAGTNTTQEASAKAADKLTGAIKAQSAGIAGAISGQQTIATATAATTDTISAQANMLGVSTTAYSTAKTATDQAAGSLAASTLQMQLQNNAAGLLNQALQSLAGQNLNVAQAQTALDSAVLTATTTLQTNKGSLDEHTQAGIADRQALEGIASALRAKAQADAAAGTSTEKVTANYQANSAALLDQVGKLDGTKSAAYQYLQQLLAIPPVQKTQIDIDDAAALNSLSSVQQKLDAIRGGVSAQVLINIAASIDQGIASSAAFTRAEYSGHADGGLVTGPGSGTSDSILARLSNGEFVMPARQAALFMPQLQAMRNGQTPAGAGGSAQVAYTAPSGQANQPILLTVQSVLDGKIVAQSVTEHQMYNNTRR